MRIFHRPLKPAAVAALALSLAACTSGDRATETAASQTAANNAAPTELRTTVTEAEQQFMTKAAQGGLTEVELGRAALEQGQSGGVKSFGRLLIDDHRAANKELMRLAVIKDVPLPTEPSDDQRKEITRLWDLKGAEFDREFLAWAHKDHQMDVDQFQRMSLEASDAQVKKFAADTLPALQKHAQRVQELMGKPR